MIGASGGIGGALADARAAAGRHDAIHRFARSFPCPQTVDIADEAAGAAAALTPAATGRIFAWDGSEIIP